METLLLYRGRPVPAIDFHFTRELTAAQSGESRRPLSQRLCEAWGWRQANETPQDIGARGLMRALCRAGQSNVTGHLDFAVKSRWAAMYTAATSIQEGTALPLSDCSGAVTRKLSAAAIKEIRDPLTLFGTVEGSQALLQPLREGLETDRRTTPRSHR